MTFLPCSICLKQNKRQAILSLFELVIDARSNFEEFEAQYVFMNLSRNKGYYSWGLTYLDKQLPISLVLLTLASHAFPSIAQNHVWEKIPCLELCEDNFLWTYWAGELAMIASRYIKCIPYAIWFYLFYIVDIDTKQIAVK